MAHNRVSDEPIYWGLFGFGGMVIGFALPAILVLLILQGLGVNCFHFFQVISHWWGAAAVFVIILGTLWHCLHRIYHGLHDLTIHPTRLHHYVLYGAAFALSVIAFVQCIGWYYVFCKIPQLLQLFA